MEGFGVRQRAREGEVQHGEVVMATEQNLMLVRTCFHGQGGR